MRIKSTYIECQAVRFSRPGKKAMRAPNVNGVRSMASCVGAPLGQYICMARKTTCGPPNFEPLRCLLPQSNS